MLRNRGFCAAAHHMTALALHTMQTLAIGPCDSNTSTDGHECCETQPLLADLPEITLTPERALPRLPSTHYVTLRCAPVSSRFGLLLAQADVLQRNSPSILSVIAIRRLGELKGVDEWGSCRSRSAVITHNTRQFLP